MSAQSAVQNYKMEATAMCVSVAGGVDAKEVKNG
jgi:hypothetical protein